MAKFKKGHKKFGGRKKGTKDKATIRKKIIEDEFKNRILKNIQELLTSQMNLAKGTSYLYRIDETEKGKRKHTLVTDPIEIEDVLDECEGEGVLDEKYYYITTKAPDNRALDSLINRVFGKPKEIIELEGGKLPFVIIIKKDDRKAKTKDS